MVHTIRPSICAKSELALLSIQAELRIGDSLGDLLEHLVTEASQCVTHVRHLLLDDLLEERSQLRQGCVLLVVEPRLDEDAVVRLELKVLGHVVDNDRLRQVSADAAQILHKNMAVGGGVLPIQAVGDAFRLVNLVKDPVSILNNS